MDLQSLANNIIKPYLLAGSSSTEAEQLRALAGHFCAKERLRVAEKVRTPADVLAKLTGDENFDVRVAAALNRNCPAEAIRRLRYDDVQVRHQLAQEIDTPRWILEELNEDKYCRLRAEALKTLAILDRRGDDELAPLRKQRLEFALSN